MINVPENEPSTVFPADLFQPGNLEICGDTIQSRKCLCCHPEKNLNLQTWHFLCGYRRTSSRVNVCGDVHRHAWATAILLYSILLVYYWYITGIPLVYCTTTLPLVYYCDTTVLHYYWHHCHYWWWDGVNVKAVESIQSHVQRTCGSSNYLCTVHEDVGLYLLPVFVWRAALVLGKRPWGWKVEWTWKRWASRMFAWCVGRESDTWRSLVIPISDSVSSRWRTLTRAAAPPARRSGRCVRGALRRLSVTVDDV